MRRSTISSALAAALVLVAASALADGPATGPLRVHPKNPRWFADGSGRAIVLVGSHTWANVQELGMPGEPPFDFDGYLAMLEANQHNFVRLWAWEHPWRASWTNDPILVAPLPYKRTGPGDALDGKPKFDLDQWDEAYFARLRERVQRLGARGIYASVMLFQGWSLNKAGSKEGDPFLAHPYNGSANVNGVDVARRSNQDEDDQPTLHSLGNPKVLARQEAYVRKVVDTVNDLDNVLYEIANEGGATAWTLHMIGFVKGYEQRKPKQHPVGMTHRISPPSQTNRDLFASPADWVSPAAEPQDWTAPGSVYLQDYKDDPPPSDGTKVVVNDTDHLWGHGGPQAWAWKSFTRGLNAIFMDPWQHLPGRLVRENVAWMFLKGGISKDQRDYPDWPLVRRSLGRVRRFAERMDLAAMTPRGDLVSTRYCLASPGREYLVYFPQGGTATLDLTDAKGELDVEWYLPVVDRTLVGPEPLVGGRHEVITAPFSGDAVLYLKARAR
jgi:hypothetical protein